MYAHRNLYWEHLPSSSLMYFLMLIVGVIDIVVLGFTVQKLVIFLAQLH